MEQPKLFDDEPYKIEYPVYPEVMDDETFTQQIARLAKLVSRNSIEVMSDWRRACEE